MQIKTKLTLVALLTTSALLGSTYLGNTFSEKESTLISIKSDINLLNKDLLTLRRHEKDFLLRMDDKYIRQHILSANELRKHAQELREKMTSLDIETQDIDRVLSDVDKYVASFNLVSSELLNIGTIHSSNSLIGRVNSDLNQFLRDRSSELHSSTTFLLAINSFLNNPTEDGYKTITSEYEKLPLEDQVLFINAIKNLKLVNNEMRKTGYSFSQGARLEMREVTHKVESAFDDMSKKVNSSIDKTNEQDHEYALLITIGLILGLFVLLISITKTISARIRLAVNQIDELSTTMDFSKKLEINKSDEIGLIQVSLNKLIDSFSSVAREVQEHSLSLNQTAKNLSAHALNLTDSTSLQSEKTEGVRQAVEGLYASISEVNEATEGGIYNSIKLSSDKANEGKIEVNNVVSHIEALSVKLNDSTQDINELAKLSEGVYNIVSVIRGIADQTNLLALNAAIEAARAGEHGRGFAVVADEVRALASKTQNSTAEITNIIETIQQQTEKVVAKIQTCKEEGDESVQRIAEVTLCINGIIEDIDSVLASTSQIVSELQSQKTTADMITSSMDEIEGLARNNRDISLDNTAIAEDIESKADDMTHSVNIFKI